jgi:vacuolar-type H+-ATPase subunit H
MRKSMRTQDASEDGAVLESDSGTASKPVESMDAHSTEVVNYEELGEHVASVLKAAELAARGIRTKAEQEAEARVSEAGRQAGRILHDAEGLRAETEDASRVLREQAEAYAGRTRQDADVEASKVLQAAQEAVATVTRDEEERQGTLREDIERSEKRLTELGAGLRDLAMRLEELVGTDRPLADEVDQRRTDDGASLDTSLIESIGADKTADAKS